MSPSRRSAICVGVVAALLPLVSACVPPAIRITSPPHGMFVSAGSSGVLVKGTLADVDPADAKVTVNGVVAQIDAATKTFSATVPFGAQRLFEPLVADLTQISNGRHVRDRVVVIRAFDVPETVAVQDAVALRIKQAGLDQLAPVLTALLEPQLDPATLLPQAPIDAGNETTIAILATPPPTLGGVTLALDAVPGGIDVTAVLSDIFVAAQIDKPTIPRLHCALEVSIGSMTVKTRQQLEPGGASGETIAVHQAAVSAGSEVLVTTAGLSSTADCSVGPGLFDGVKERNMRERIQSELAAAIADFLADPDGTSGVDSAPISAAIEAQLAGLDIGRVTVPGLRSTVGARFAAIDEQDAQIDTSFDVDVDPKGIVPVAGSGLAIPHAVFKPDPNLSGSLNVPAIYPTFASSVRSQVGLGLSFSGLNRLLMSETEARRFQIVVDEVQSGGTTVPFTASTLALVPQFAALPPATPLRARIKATLAPVLTGNAGPHGELVEVQVAHVVVSIAKLVIDAQGGTTESEQLRLAIDARAGVNLTLANGALAATLGTLQPGDLTITVLANPIGADETLLEVAGPIVLASELPEIVGTAASFPIPSLLDLSLQAKAIQRKAGYLVLFANLVPQP
ncbi:hypothetical protein K2Z84_15585 [Candidatus Binatia bacterium]|nr:hypothetical protein [Candidatus Binatia bacterium]